MSRNHYNRGIGCNFLKFFKYLNAIHSGHFNVAQNDIKSTRFNLIKCFNTVFCKVNYIFFVFKNIF